MKKGFTLIETLIYIALFGLLLVGVIVSAYPLITGADKLGLNVLEEGEVSFVFHKIGWALHSASNVGVSGNVLTVNRLSSGTVSFGQGTGNIEMSTGGSYDPLTASRVVFSGFSVTHTAPPGGVINAPHIVLVTFLANGESYSQTYNVFY